MGSQSDESTRVVPDSENGKAGGKTVSLANNSLGMTAGNGSYVQQSIEIVTPMKLYDPNDPSTFPKTPGPAGASGLSHSATVNYGAHSRLPSDGSNGGYSGMPEI
ncbi:uncharacterized protein EI90DRAFT_3062210 [Cantharellus anzutake]|uniref:uncharacterized protein n=1 Tax=Cantharellus anzutake TaxID=1750568 RepID=UPI0019033374|nr:uncharacterized protein EI90DRAFT_3062210 [Cantharellus anzutake]KAF8329848.1 hypothetical protein EI90DRAFT_3062210 [Cantharellus anzutake]